MPMSLGEDREYAIATNHYPDGTFTNYKQKAVDIIRGGTIESKEIITPEIRNAVTGVVERPAYSTHIDTSRGDQWVQLKSLKPVQYTESGEVDFKELNTRLNRNVDEAFRKVAEQIKDPHAVFRSSVRSDDPTVDFGDRYKLNLEDPKGFEVFIELPGLEKLPAEQQAAIKEYVANRAAQAASNASFKSEVDLPTFTTRVEGQLTTEAKAAVGTPVELPHVARDSAATKFGSAEAEAAEAVALAKSRQLVAQAGAGERAGGVVKTEGALFLIFTVGAAVYIYTNTDGEERVLQLKSFAAGTVFGLAAATLAAKIAGAPGGLATLLLDYNGDGDPNLDEAVTKIVAQLYPKADGDEYDLRVKQVRYALKHGLPVDFNEDPVPIERKLEEPRPFVPPSFSIEKPKDQKVAYAAARHAFKDAVNGANRGQVRGLPTVRAGKFVKSSSIIDSLAAINAHQTAMTNAADANRRFAESVRQATNAFRSMPPTVVNLPFVHPLNTTTVLPARPPVPFTPPPVNIPYFATMPSPPPIAQPTWVYNVDRNTGITTPVTPAAQPIQFPVNALPPVIILR